MRVSEHLPLTARAFVLGYLLLKISATILLILLSKKEALTENTNHFMIFVKEHMARILINEPLRA